MTDINVRVSELMQLIGTMTQDITKVIHEEDFSENANELVVARHRLLLELVSLSSEFKDQQSLRQFLENLRDSEAERIELITKLRDKIKMTLINMNSLRMYAP